MNDQKTETPDGSDGKTKKFEQKTIVSAKIVVLTDKQQRLGMALEQTAKRGAAELGLSLAETAAMLDFTKLMIQQDILGALAQPQEPEIVIPTPGIVIPRA